MKHFYCEITEWDFSEKTDSVMILANNTKWDCSHLFGCGKANFEPLAMKNIHYIIFITALLLVRTACLTDPHITDWVTMTAKVPREFEVAT